MNFKSVITALITPFKKGEVDFTSLKRLVKHQLDDGIGGFVVNGTTAESPTLTSEERKNILNFVKAEVSGQVPIIMGTGSNSTAKTVEDSKQAQALKADAILVVVPYYNKPPQRGLVAHFKTVAESVSIPVILYNVPGRTITSLELNTIIDLSKISNIIGVKEASGNIAFATDIRKSCSPDFILLSGDDGTYVDFLKAGGDGVISVTSHVVAKEMLDWQKQVQLGKDAEDSKKYKTLFDELFCEANPIPLKMALYWQGIIDSPELRLPLCELASKHHEPLKKEMKELGLL